MMKKNIYRLMLLAVITLILSSCEKKEDDLTASEENQGYVLPQGTHDYDATIVDFYETYGTYLLYIFEDKDTYWTPTSWNQATQASAGYWNTGYDATPADELYVGEQLDLIQELWFNLYPEAFLDEFLPVKIMLCSELDSIYTGYDFSTWPISYIKKEDSVAAWYNYDNICVGGGNATVSTMTASAKKDFRYQVNRVFVESIIERELLSPTDAFTNIANYTTITNTASGYAQGVFYDWSGTTATIDWGKYMLAMVSCSEAYLNESYYNWDSSFRGILNATKDINGKMKQRYDIVRNYYITNYGLDLQAIGNLAVQ